MQKLQDFLADRRISEETAKEAGIVSHNGMVTFEFRRKGEVLFRKIRREVIEAGQRTKTFWIEPKGSELFLWNEDSLSVPCGKDTPLILTEGEVDAASFLACGFTHVVSVPNGSSLSKPGEGDIIPSDDHAFRYLWQGDKLHEGLRHWRKIILATDGDKPGLLLRDELAIRLGRDRCWFVEYPEGCKDANDVLTAFGEEGITDLVADAKPIVPSRLVQFSDIPSNADQPRYSSGWEQLDAHLRVVTPELMVVTGIPGSGKSQWTLALCANLARLYSLKGAILQFEDNPERNRTDLLAYAQSWQNQPKNGLTMEPDAWVDKMFRTIAPIENADDDVDYSLPWLKGVIEEAATRHGCKWILIDPWNEIEHAWKVNESETAYTNQALRDLKRLSRRLQIAIIIVAHPSKGANGKGIADLNMYDVSGSQAWANKADHGIVIHRESPTAEITYVKIAKSKNFAKLGVPGIVQMRFAPKRASFEFVGHGI